MKFVFASPRALLAAVALFFASDTRASTAFTYQGFLQDSDVPAGGNYDLRFELFGSPSEEKRVGPAIYGGGLPIVNGVFSVHLDFGGEVFEGEPRWIEVAVRPAGSEAEYTVLTPRQPLSPAPYAIMAQQAGAFPPGAVTSAALAPGAVTSEKIAPLAISDLHVESLSASKVAGGDLGAERVKAGVGHSLSGHLATIAGGQSNVVAASFATVAGGQQQFIAVSAERSAIGGGAGNAIHPESQGGAIAGGVFNLIGTNSSYGAISGGLSNAILSQAAHAAIGGGVGNRVGSEAWQATIGGGATNQIDALSFASTIAGGSGNRIAGANRYATISGGKGNVSGDRETVIAGGLENTIESAARSAVIGGGEVNRIQGGARSATVAGGTWNLIGSDAFYSTVGGGLANEILAGSGQATISGGRSNQVAALAENSTIGGGFNNGIGTGSSHATVAGGTGNHVRSASPGGTVSGGTDNVVLGASDAVIGGGRQNLSGASYSVIAGGRENVLFTGASYSAIGGGSVNQIEESWGASIGGGTYNSIGGNASYGVIAGGLGNRIVGENCLHSAILGGVSNQVSHFSSVVLGGERNHVSAPFALAAGRRARAGHIGTFVWADSSESDFLTERADQFLIRARGGVGIGTSATQDAPLSVEGVQVNKVNLSAPSVAHQMRLGFNSVMAHLVSNAIFRNAWERDNPALPSFAYVQHTGSKRHEFRVAEPAASLSWTTAMVITTDSRVGIGVVSPSYRLTLPNQANAEGRGLANAWHTYSSARWKTEVQTLDQPLDTVRQLRGVRYRWKEGGAPDIGLIAGEVADVLPEIVSFDSETGEAASVDYARLVSVLVEAVKEQQSAIEALKTELGSREQQWASLEARLAALEQREE
jgi:hypothetical protein